MAQQGKGKGFAVVLSLVAIAGVVGYLIYRKYKNKPKGTDSSTTPEFTPAPTPTSTGGGSTGGGSTSSGNPFATKDALLKFQKWVIKTIGDKTILGKGGSTGFGDDGSWGSKSASAWAKYQSPYDPAKVNDDGTMKSTPNNTGGSTTTSTLKKVITTDYVNFYKTPSSFLPINALPYRPNEILGTSDGKEYYDGNTPYYLVNVAPSIVNDVNYSGVGQSGIPTSYVKARAVKLT